MSLEVITITINVKKLMRVNPGVAGPALLSLIQDTFSEYTNSLTIEDIEGDEEVCFEAP